jgi:TetR/AcrR family transcriptional regulator
VSTLPSHKNSEARGGTAERILDAAEIVFAERGFAGAAIRDIAARVELNPASLYNHFPGKQDLYEAVLDRGLQPIVELLRGIAEESGVDGWDFDAIDSVVDHLAAQPALARILQYEALAGGENITRLAGRWLAPIYAQGVSALKKNPGSESWDPSELPLLIEAFHNIILGYFATAPLREKILGEDPLSERALERQKHFLRNVAARLLAPKLPPE